MPTWAVAFGTALAIALAAVARCRRLALSIGFVDVPVPGERKNHPNPVPYLGGVGLVLGVLSGLVFEYPLASKVALIVLAATLLAAIGLVDDDRTVSPSFRLAAELLAATVATAAGLRIHATAIPILDFALTVIWIVGITNALNLLDNMDGLAAGITAVASAGVFVLAVGSGQPVIATFAAATAGACLGFLAFNKPPASVFMGDSGSLFLGFVLAVITIDVDVALPTPRGFLVPLMLLAIPVTDTTMVTVARLRRHRSVLQGGRDHLSHRLVARGTSPRQAVAKLLGLEAILALVAVLAGREIVPLAWAVVLSVAVVGTLVARTARVRVYQEPILGMPRKVRRAALLLLVGLPVLAAPAVLGLLRAAAPARAGANAAVAALRALEQADADTTDARFQEARAELAKADKALHGPLVAAGLVVPGVASNLRAAQALVSIGAELSEQGSLLASTYTAQSLTVDGGAVPLDKVRELSPLLDRAEGLIVQAQRRLRHVERGFVLPPLTRAIDDAQALIDRQAARSPAIAQLARILPDLLGGNGTRRYFLAFQNNAELRGSGGFMGNWGELVAEGGKIRIDRFGRMDDLTEAARQPLRLVGMDEFLRRWREFDVPRSWQQVNLSPDFPTTAQVISQLYPQSGGQRIDGVIAIDPFGLAGLLNLTGPIRVPHWNQPITSQNLVDVTLRQAYEVLPQDQRVEFLGEVARAVAATLTSADLGSPSRLGDALGGPVARQNLKIWLARPEEQRLMHLLHADGAVAPLAGDSLLVVDQNVAANKIDFYLRRVIDYEVRLEPTSGSREVDVDGQVIVTLENTAPPGLSSIVVGPYDNRFKAGENRTYVSVYTPFAAGPTTVNGQPVTPTSDIDLGRSAHSLEVSVPAQQAVSVAMALHGEATLSEDGWFRIDIGRQPSVAPDQVNGRVVVPDGWKITNTVGAKIVSSRTATYGGEVTAPTVVWVKIERAGVGRVLDKLLRAG